MNPDIEPALLISLAILIAIIGFIVWWYGRRKDEPTSEVLFRGPGQEDKLTLINGIGPTLEGKLNKIGIVSFKQIAEFTEADIEQVNQVLNFKGRIGREAWVIQAKKLVQAGSPSVTSPRKEATEANKKSVRTTPAKKYTKKSAKKKASRRTKIR